MRAKENKVTKSKEIIKNKTPKVILVQEVDIEEGEVMVYVEMVEGTMGRSSAITVIRSTTT